jgi:iron complex outermembrane recepter protein
MPFSQTSTDATLTTDSAAGYGQASYDFGEGTKLTLGGRYTWEQRDLASTHDALLPSGTLLPGALIGKPPVDAGIKADVFTWRAAVEQKLSESVMAYISASRGFKSGGFNLQTPANPPFRPELLDAYEAGLKNTLFDRRLRLNASAFYYDYRNIQVTRFSETGGTLLYNGAGAQVYGIDMDAEAKITDRFSLSAVFEGLHTDFTSFPNAVISTPVAHGRLCADARLGDR